MAFDWKEFLKLARFLSGESDVRYSREGAYRSAVSRAYFAAFCYARNYARDNQGFVPTGKWEDHGRLRRHFQDIGRIDIAFCLDDLRQWRNACDYHDEVQNLRQIAVDAIKNAEDIISNLW